MVKKVSIGSRDSHPFASKANCLDPNPENCIQSTQRLPNRWAPKYENPATNSKHHGNHWQLNILSPNPQDAILRHYHMPQICIQLRKPCSNSQKLPYSAPMQYFGSQLPKTAFYPLLMAPISQVIYINSRTLFKAISLASQMPTFCCQPVRIVACQQPLPNRKAPQKGILAIVVRIAAATANAIILSPNF